MDELSDAPTISTDSADDVVVAPGGSGGATDQAERRRRVLEDDRFSEPPSVVSDCGEDRFSDAPEIESDSDSGRSSCAGDLLPVVPPKRPRDLLTPLAHMDLAAYGRSFVKPGNKEWSRFP